MIAQAGQSRFLVVALILLPLLACASTPAGLNLRAGPGGSLAYVLADPPLYLSVSRETGERLGLSETERYLTDLAQRLRTHVADLEAKSVLPAYCSVSVRMLAEPGVACIRRHGNPTAEPLEALLRVTMSAPRERAGAELQDLTIQVEIGSASRP
jgi:hypothetical protein